MEEVIGSILGILRFLVVIIWEGAGMKILWYIGWPITRLLSLGRFPKHRILEVEKASPLVIFLVIGVGIVAIFSLLFYLANNFG